MILSTYASFEISNDSNNLFVHFNAFLYIVIFSSIGEMSLSWRQKSMKPGNSYLIKLGMSSLNNG